MSEPARKADSDAPDSGLECPSCHQDWLRPAPNLPGRYRCLWCLHRYELMSVCPDCGEHSTIVRMTDAATLSCASCGALMLRNI